MTAKKVACLTCMQSNRSRQRSSRIGRPLYVGDRVRSHQWLDLDERTWAAWDVELFSNFVKVWASNNTNDYLLAESFKEVYHLLSCALVPLLYGFRRVSLIGDIPVGPETKYHRHRKGPAFSGDDLGMLRWTCLAGWLGVDDRSRWLRWLK